ncbi:50S ribosomal protein L7ae-like protein [Microaerobacter geothermalis]|uniref:50S ribosomal protein L7ae-like protein n=1 Tax=Microaerobacter geothermalis TaxID=674972 RepID=UPI001F3E3B43|nr:50S ribosomal protein L7ae-like protein [Microaerobacter geothermalis]MCF6094792.1 50S ribosomal protein L7ae-like protein [Microaerobacter geothermalis]
MSYEKVKQASNTIIGTKQTLKAIESDSVAEVIIARDADKRVVSGAIKLCQEKGVPLSYVDSMKKLGRACGIDVGAAMVAIRKER